MIDQVLRRSLAALLLFLSCTVFAQETATATDEEKTEKTTLVTATDSREVRQELEEVLRRLPPDVGKVLKLDPSLWNNPAYLKSYPTLAAFVTAHPDVANSPSFYLESVWIPSDPAPETPGFRLWNQLLETFSILMVLVFVSIVLTWLIRTIIEQRRWTRLSRIQAEVHNKLMDRFSQNEELLNYIQTPAGKRFLESAPIPLAQAAERPVSAPIGRILLSVQAGLVTLAGGIGLKVISGNIAKDAAEPLAALGTLGISVGIGLVISAFASLMLSRRLGLWRDTVSAETTASE
jgi:hypothetical protein